MLFICQWLLFVKVMQSRHDMKWNVNFVWATHCYAQKEGGRAAGFTFTITVMIQSSLIIIPLPGMSAPIENRRHVVHTKQLLGRPGTVLQAQWFTPCEVSLSQLLHTSSIVLSASLFVSAPVFLAACLSLSRKSTKTWRISSSLSLAFNVAAEQTCWGELAKES